MIGSNWIRALAPAARATVGRIAAAVVATCMLLPSDAAPRSGRPEPPPAPSARAGNGARAEPWLRVDYGPLVDRRRLTHSGESVGELLRELDGRPRPAPGTRARDDVAYRLLDPWLEPYAFVLPDAIDSLAPAPDPPMVEIGYLWRPGEARPAWVDLLQSRRYLLESDGAGRLRAFLPWPEGEKPEAPAGQPRKDPVEASHEAWDDAWPVLRHVLAAERARLASRRPGSDAPALEVEARAYRHDPARSAFDLAAVPFLTRVAETSPRGDRPPLDLEALRRIVESGRRLEGARLDPDGRLTWFTSDPERPPSLLGRRLELSDFSVAYRAAAHGGLAEPYMSLDKGPAPQTTSVNYGGRLQDTAVGLVSLLCDVRFKTFSLGIGVLGEGDLRDRIRRDVPGFRTHLERFAADPAAGGVLSQQTRFWFYPDDVDLTLSETGDVLAIRRVRMSAASERVESKGDGAKAADPSWTRDTVAFLNGEKDRFASIFPEIADLDTAARLLAVFTWLAGARAEGLVVPDLDVLLAVELPALPTPRAFPQLLTYDALPAAGGAGRLDSWDQSRVGAALDRLRPRGGAAVDADRRLRRAVAALDSRISDQAAYARELLSRNPESLPPEALDALAAGAERLTMHQRVLATLPEPDRKSVGERRAAGEAVRVFSIGMGGIDLGMSKALARAGRRSRKAGPAGFSAIGVSDAGRGGAPVPTRDARPPQPPREPRDPEGVPRARMRDHGMGDASTGARTWRPDPEVTLMSRHCGNDWVLTGSYALEPGKAFGFSQVVLGADGPDVRSRRRNPDLQGKAPVFQRAEGGRYLSFKFEGSPGTLRAMPAEPALPPAVTAPAWTSFPRPPAAEPAPSAVPPEPATAGLAMLEVVKAASADTSRAEPATVRLRLRTAAGRSSEADFPRAVLQRLVLGREVDLVPDRPLPALAPRSKVLGEANGLMVLADPADERRPWVGPNTAVVGEEDPVRLAAALNAWWRAGEPAGAAAVVGTDPTRSPAHWSAAPKMGAGALVLAPDDAFPGLAAAAGDSLRRRLPAERTARSLPDGSLPGLVVLVSGESPSVLAARVRSVAADPRMAGRLLGVVALGDPARADLPAAILAETGVAGLAWLEAGPVDWKAVPDDLARFLEAVDKTGDRGGRYDAIPGPFVWYY